jgi:hypothetical protein
MAALTNRRGHASRTAATGTLRAPAPFKLTGWKTVFVDHLSFEVGDYQRSVAFYGTPRLAGSSRDRPSGVAGSHRPRRGGAYQQ